MAALRHPGGLPLAWLAFYTAFRLLTTINLHYYNRAATPWVFVDLVDIIRCIKPSHHYTSGILSGFHWLG